MFRNFSCGLGAIGNAVALEIPGVGDVPKCTGSFREFWSQDFAHLIRGPDVELALHTLAVRIFRRVERACGGAHVSLDVGQHVPRTLGVHGLARHLMGLQQCPHEQRVVVEHLLEVRNQPFVVGAVAAQTAADLVVDAACEHFLERVFHHLQRFQISGAEVVPQQQLQSHARRKLVLRLKLEAPVIRIVAFAEILGGCLLGLPAGNGGSGALRLGIALEVSQQIPGNVFQLATVAVPQLHELFQHCPERGASVKVVGREVGAAGDGPTVRKHKHVERPTALLSQRMKCVHVELVHIRAFLAVHLDRHEVGVEEFRQFRILEGFALHDVAPVAGRVADAHQHQLVLRLSLRKRLRPPRLPVHRIVRVLEQVGAFLADQAVAELGCVRHGAFLRVIPAP